MEESLDQFYLDQAEPHKSCLLALRNLILQSDELLTETRKYGMPCFCYKKKALCYLWKDKKTGEPYILMVEGKRLQHPKLEQGERSRMKIFPVDSSADLPIEEIRTLLEEALQLYQSGSIKVK
ncbi:DUF1801 domain-containing protein [Marinilongibacter aquaticus]|uniref:DUF1801 domain-containing protein n=1 Tax=Marinilongibacter aquaticus TaxID=2975157 RepID=UPI0021BDC589|nr:DUF1801 domain-containing protein [Marinilongibacter aquaticus]UBM59245.1 DUF1801 domain-containing protein [Marinilongibacter aquaticus]